MSEEQTIVERLRTLKQGDVLHDGFRAFLETIERDRDGLLLEMSSLCEKMDNKLFMKTAQYFYAESLLHRLDMYLMEAEEETETE